MPSTIDPVASSDELRLLSDDEGTTIASFSNTIPFIRHVMCLAATLPIAFLSKSVYFKTLTLHGAMIVFYGFPMTPKTAQVICALSLVLSTTLYCIKGGIPQNLEGEMEILHPLLILYFRRLEATPEESIHTQLPKDIVVRCVEESLLSLLDCFYAFNLTGNALTLALKPGACLFALLWPWVLTPSMALYESWWRHKVASLKTTGTQADWQPSATAVQQTQHKSYSRFSTVLHHWLLFLRNIINMSLPLVIITIFANPSALKAGVLALAAFVFTQYVVNGNAIAPTPALGSFVVPYAIIIVMTPYEEWFTKFVQERRQNLAILPPRLPGKCELLSTPKSGENVRWPSSTLPRAQATIFDNPSTLILVQLGTFDNLSNLALVRLEKTTPLIPFDILAPSQLTNTSDCHYGAWNPTAAMMGDGHDPAAIIKWAYKFRSVIEVAEGGDQYRRIRPRRGSRRIGRPSNDI
ncbi:hypothetical protein GGS20DRAFT_587322 [Poronia punctata]|nr:hypothetical protein GGS20DRAFT_587322 [Poronia punctata]